MKDLVGYLEKGEDFKWEKVIGGGLFVGENKMIGDLVGDFEGKKMEIGVVVDEFGGRWGMVRMEEMMEEIVGEMNDE